MNLADGQFKLTHYPKWGLVDKRPRVHYFIWDEKVSCSTGRAQMAERGIRMLIPAVFEDGECRLVEAGRLNELVAGGKVKRFLRMDGWTAADRKAMRAIRTNGAAEYNGRERRQGFRLYNDSLTDTDLSCRRTG